MIIGTLSFVNFVLLLYLLVIDVQNRKLRTLTEGANTNYLSKPKSWILILGVSMNFIQFLRYFINPPVFGNFVFNGLLYICEALKYGIYMLIFYYFLKKAASLFPKETVSKWTRIIKIMTVVSSIIYTVFALESIIVYARPKNPNAKEYCKNF